MRTENFYLTAFLIAKGYEMNDAIMNGRKWTFYFDDSVRDDEMKYFSRKATVNASAFESSIRNLKSLIANHKYKDDNYYSTERNGRVTA